MLYNAISYYFAFCNRKMLVRKFILLFFLSGLFSSYVSAITTSTCSDADIACASIVSGSIVYEDPVYNSSGIDFDAFASGSLMVLNVDTNNWNLTTFGHAFLVTADTSTHKVTSSVYFLESDGTPDFTKAAKYYVVNDPASDKVGSTYILFVNQGVIEQTGGDFINQGVTAISAGATFSYTAATDADYFYSDVLKIGDGSGNSVFELKGRNFSFRTAEIINSDVQLYGIQNVLIQGVDREITVYGNTLIAFHSDGATKFFLDNSLFESKITFNFMGDNNMVVLDSSAFFGWYTFDYYVETEGPSMYFTCSSACSGNGFYLTAGAELHLSTLSLVNVSTMQVNLYTRSRYNVEHFVLENSNLVYDLERSTFESALSNLSTPSANTGSIVIDAGSSFVLNATTESIVHFHNTDFTVEGSFEMNISDDTVTRFFDEVEIISSSNDTIFNFTDVSVTNFDDLVLIEGLTDIDFSGDSTGDFAILEMENTGILNFDATDSAEVSFTEVYMDSSEDSHFNFSNSSKGTFSNFNMLSGLIYTNFSGSSSGTFSNFDLTDGTFFASFAGNSTGEFGTIKITDGILNVTMSSDAIVVFDGDLFGVGGTGGVFVNVTNNALLHFKDVDFTNTSLTATQMVYLSGAEQTLLRFEKSSTFLDDNFIYKYNLSTVVKNNDFSVKATSTSIVMIQIKNDGPVGAFPYEDEVIAKIEAAGGSIGGGGGGDGGDGGGDGSSFSVLIDYEAGTGGGGSSSSGIGLIDYKDINGTEYAEFGLGVSGGGGGSTGTFTYNKAQEQYGEEEGLLTLTTIENMNSYGVAVVFDNIVLSTTDTEPYRVTLFNLVINNSRTVEQLGQTLNSLNANITLSNVLYAYDILVVEDKHNAITLLDGDRFNAYAEVRKLTNENFEGNYLLFGASITFYDSVGYRLGISGFFSPYASTTIYDGAEQSSNMGASLFGAIQVGQGAIMFDVSIMHSEINGTALEILSAMDKREYTYGGNSAGATLSYNFGSYFSQRMIVSAFATQSSSYTENPSDLALHVITPSYYNAFVGYYSKLINGTTFILELGLKYYIKEGQIGGTAGFINDPAGQVWAYQYILLDSPVEFNLDFSYKIFQTLEIKAGLNKRGTYNNFGIYLMYKKPLSIIEEDNYYNVGGIIIDV